MRSHHFLAVPFIAASFAAGNPILERAACKQDNCVRGILQTSSVYKPSLSVRLADCSGFMTTTITPAATTITVTNTATATTVTTLPAPLKKRDPVTNFASQPAYATWCVDTAAYSSGCSCAGIPPATVTAPTPSITVTASWTSTYTSIATPSATGFYIQASSPQSAVDGQCAFFNPSLSQDLTFIGISNYLVPPTLFTLDSNGYLYSNGLQAMTEAEDCEFEYDECSSKFVTGYTPAQVASISFLKPLVCSLEGAALSCSYNLGSGPDLTLSFAGLQGPQDTNYILGEYNPFFDSSSTGEYSVTFTAVADISQCSSVPSSTGVVAVPPNPLLTTPFYLQDISGSVVNGQCAFLQDDTADERPSALSFLGNNGNNCGRSIPQFTLDTNGLLTTTDGHQLGTYIACNSGLNNCGTRYVRGFPTTNIQYYGPAYYPLVCSYDQGNSLLNCAFAVNTAGSYGYFAYEDNSGFYEAIYGLPSGPSSLQFRVITNLGACAAGC